MPSSTIYENLSSFGSTSSVEMYPSKTNRTAYQQRTPQTLIQQQQQQSNRLHHHHNQHLHNRPSEVAMEHAPVHVHPSYRREYTLNEIFDNLKKFKRQAKEQEMLTSNMYDRVTTTGVRDDCLVRSGEQQQHLQQQNHTRTYIDNNKNNINNSSMIRNHVYVNQRIANVTNATFV